MIDVQLYSEVPSSNPHITNSWLYSQVAFPGEKKSIKMRHVGDDYLNHA